MRTICNLLIVLALLVVSASAWSQSARWKRTRWELTGGVGSTNFFGELGGSDKDGKQLLMDIDFRSSRPAFSVGLRYKVLEVLAARVNLSYAIVHGSDENTKNIFRSDRNLSFRSPVYEFATILEYSIIKEKVSHRYNLRRKKGFSLKGLHLNTYIFGGLGGFYFNPKAKYNGKWVALQPLGTEGQGLVETREKYKRISVCLPFGFGVKYSINRNFSVGLEYGGRYTFTDYIDDVSTTYVDNNWLRAERGDMVADLADPSLKENEITTIYGAGDQRGNPKYDDFYMFTQVTIVYKLRTGRSGLPKF